MLQSHLGLRIPSMSRMCLPSALAHTRSAQTIVWSFSPLPFADTAFFFLTNGSFVATRHCQVMVIVFSNRIFLFLNLFLISVVNLQCCVSNRVLFLFFFFLIFVFFRF